MYKLNYNQYIQNKTKNKLHMKGIKYACFKLGKKAAKKVKKNKNNFINIVGDKFTMSNRWGDKQFHFVWNFSVV